MSIHTEEPAQDSEVVTDQPQVNLSENGYDHSQDDPNLAIDIDLGVLEHRVNEIISNPEFGESRFSNFVELLELNFSTRELAFMSASGIIDKLGSSFSPLRP